MTISKKEQGQLARILTIVLFAGILGTYTVDILKDMGVQLWHGLLVGLLGLLAVFYFNLNNQISRLIGKLVNG